MIETMVKNIGIATTTFYGTQTHPQKKKNRRKANESIGDENQIPDRRTLLNGLTNNQKKTPSPNLIRSNEAKLIEQGFKKAQKKFNQKYSRKALNNCLDPINDTKGTSDQISRTNGVSLDMNALMDNPSPLQNTGRSFEANKRVRTPDNETKITDYFQTKSSTIVTNINVENQLNSSPVTPIKPEIDCSSDSRVCQTPKRWRQSNPLEEVESNEISKPITPIIMDDIQTNDYLFCDFNDENMCFEPNTPIGLKNLGNTCYMNSMVQSLFALKFIIEDIESNFNSICLEGEDNFQMTRNLLKLYKEYNGLRTETENHSMDNLMSYLSDLKACVGQKWNAFNSYCQQDAAEFFSHVIEKIADEFESYNEKKNNQIPNPIHRNFRFETNGLLKCENCGNRRKSDNGFFQTLYLSIPEDLSLYTAFNDFMKDETTSHQCVLNNCGTNRNLLTKSFSKLRKVLFLQLGRYTEDGLKRNEQVIVPPMIELSVTTNPSEQSIAPSPLATPYRLKLKNVSICNKNSSVVRKITFEENPQNISENNCEKIVLENETQSHNNEDVNQSSQTITTSFENDSQKILAESVSTKQVKYQLWAVVCHHGISLLLGHYTCYVYSIDNNKWFECDDNRITETNFETVQKSSETSGYCFFYVLRPD